MKRAKRRKPLSRTQKIWASVLATVVGTAAIAGLVIWADVRRDTDLGDPTAGITATAKQTAQTQAPPIRFRNVAEAAGVLMRHGPGQRSRALPEDTGSGVAWGDYDGDGDWDLYAVSFPDPSSEAPGSTNGSTNGSNRLFRNDGDRFADVTERAGVGDPRGFGMGATWADYDDDGDEDLYVTNFGPNRLYRNRGDGTFEPVAATAGVADPAWSTGAAWGDFDRDGHLDLYVCNYVDYDADVDIPGPERVPDAAVDPYQVPYSLNPNSFDSVPNRLYRNRGDGTFEDVAERYGVDNPDGRSLAATLCDLDGDGWLDLYVNNDVSTNRLFRNMAGDRGVGIPADAGAADAGAADAGVADAGAANDGAVLFADLSTITGTADPRGSMGLSVGEIGSVGGNVDGLPDLFITHWVAQENALYQSLITSGGDLEYRDKTRQCRLGEVSIDTVGWGCALVDVDLDGRVDLVVANGSTLERKDDPRHLIAEPIFLFWNDGSLFQNVAPAAGELFMQNYDARGLAAADFDDDGDVDVAIAVNRGQPLLLRNETQTDNRYLKIRLQGPPAARFGAKVEVVSANRRQLQWFGADVTFLGMHAPELIFGLGQNTGADRVDVTWADGRQTTLTDVSPGRVEVTHPDTPPVGRVGDVEQDRPDGGRTAREDTR